LSGSKKNLALSIEAKRSAIDEDHGMISVSRQCELLGLCRSSLYYESSKDDSYNAQLMRLLDEQFTMTPFYGVPRMTAWLRSQGHAVNRKRVSRLMKLMGLQAIYPRPKTSAARIDDRKFTYLLRGLDINRPDQVWATDITYIRMSRGFVYLVAVMDWHSRYVLSWEISISLDADFCVAALERSLAGGRPDIFNSDQGSQFTSLEFTGRLLSAGVRISMDGRGRFLDNIFVERLWRSVKYEEVYLKSYENVRQARDGLNGYFEFYNGERLHQSLGYRTPFEVYHA
jgi:putative transposase